MCTPEQATDIFDSLPPVTMKDLHIGRWRADILRTGHPAEELMPALGWYGKQVISSREVQPFLFCTRGGRVFPLRPRALPFGMVGKTPLLLARIGRTFLGPGRPVLGSHVPAAEIHMRWYRGQLSASIDHRYADCRDHLRRISDSILMGAAVFGDFKHPFFFVLYHEADDEAPASISPPRAAEVENHVPVIATRAVDAPTPALVPVLALDSSPHSEVERLTTSGNRPRHRRPD